MKKKNNFFQLKPHTKSYASGQRKFPDIKISIFHENENNQKVKYKNTRKKTTEKTCKIKNEKDSTIISLTKFNCKT